MILLWAAFTTAQVTAPDITDRIGMGALCSILVHSGTVSCTFLHSGAFWRTPAIQAPDSTDHSGIGASWSIRLGAFWDRL